MKCEFCLSDAMGVTGAGGDVTMALLQTVMWLSHYTDPCHPRSSYQASGRQHFIPSMTQPTCISTPIG